MEQIEDRVDRVAKIVVQKGEQSVRLVGVNRLVVRGARLEQDDGAVAPQHRLAASQCRIFEALDINLDEIDAMRANQIVEPPRLNCRFACRSAIVAVCQRRKARLVAVLEKGDGAFAVRNGDRVKRGLREPPRQLACFRGAGLDHGQLPAWGEVGKLIGHRPQMRTNIHAMPVRFDDAGQHRGGHRAFLAQQPQFGVEQTAQVIDQLPQAAYRPGQRRSGDTMLDAQRQRQG